VIGGVDPEIIPADDSQVEFISLLKARSAVKSRFIVATSSAHGFASTGSVDERRGDGPGTGAGTAVVPLRRGSGTATAAGGWFACRRRAGGLAAGGMAVVRETAGGGRFAGGGGGVGANSLGRAAASSRRADARFTRARSTQR
jgi:hypothetical protein